MTSCGRVGKSLPIEALGVIPSIAVARALEAWTWARKHGRDPQDSMLRARIAFRMAAPDHGRSLGWPFPDQRNRDVLLSFGPVWSLASMRYALEIDVALGVKEAAEERRHEKAQQAAEVQAATVRRIYGRRVRT